MTHWINSWQRPAQIQAVQTSNSLSHHPSFDMHPEQATTMSINRLVAEFELPHKPQFLRQVHGNQIATYIKPPESQLGQQADACFTRSKNVICAILTADCLPVLLTDSAGSFVAAVHCGWRSLYSNILSETLHKINSKHQIHAWFGPCIQQPQYEVDESFVINFLEQHPNCHSAFTAIKARKSLASLYTIASIQLNLLGVNHVQTANQCTFLSSDYYSWRQNKSPKRMATLVWLSAE